MTTGTRLTAEFGKRAPAPLPPAPGPKRSNHVALLVMGTLAVGGGAYAMMPSNRCEQPPNATMQNDANCPPRSSSGGSSGSGGGGSSSRSSYYSSDSSSSHASSSTAAAGTSNVARGGFGSFGHAFGFSGG